MTKPIRFDFSFAVITYFTASSGLIQSPDYPDVYPPKYTGYFSVKVHGAVSIAFDFLFFEIEFNKDALYYGTDPSLSMTMDELHGNLSNSKLEVDGDFAWFLLETDRNNAAPWDISSGFNIQYVAGQSSLFLVFVLMQ